MAPSEPSAWDPLLRYLLPFAAALFGLFGSIFVYKEKVSNIEKNVDRLTAEVRETRDKIIACETSLKERERETYIKRKSPLALTDSGERLLKDSGGEDFVNNHYELLAQKVEDNSPKTAYDIQELSQQVITWLKSEDIFNSLKDYAFKTGLPLEIIIEVMGIYLRDKILRAKGWNAEDVDRHDPANQKPLPP